MSESVASGAAAAATQGASGTPPTLPPPTETVTLTVDGRQIVADKGELMISALERAGVYIPRFCYHPRMKPVGMCRMCLVQVKGPRGFSLMPACFNPVADGQEIVTTSSEVRKAQDGVLEFLLINHPLDCPVCDKGGECPLQDQTLAYGPGESRFVEEKRHWDKPIPISELVYLDRERCIQCARCTRFADEVAGDPLIDFAERGDRIEVATFPDQPFTSYFSGNIVQICPVGALTAKPYRFRARPWDLEQVESTCASCSVGCRVAVQSSSDEITRLIGVDSDPVNWGWLCDKGRFDYESVNSPERLSVPLVRKNDELVEVSWAEALRVAADGLAVGREHAGQRVGIIGGARLPNEDAYAWSKLARVVLGTDNVDAHLGDGLPAVAVAGLPRATIDQTAAASLVITLAPDLKEELPVLYLRLRHAAVNDGLNVIELTPQRTGFSRYAAETLCYRPGEVGSLVQAIVSGTGGAAAGVDEGAIDRVRQALAGAWGRGAIGQPDVVVILGRPSLAESAEGVAHAAQLLAGAGPHSGDETPRVAFLSALRRSNVHGALDMGLAPGVLPGRVDLDTGRSWYEQHWGVRLPARAGLDTIGMLRAAAEGRMDALVLLGADPLADFPDVGLAAQALERTGFVVAVDTFLTESNRHADVLLPAATYAERRGTFTNLEGRVSWLGQTVTAPGVAWPDWTIAVELAAAAGVELGPATLEDLWEEIAEVSPLHDGLSVSALTRGEGRNGVLVPLDRGGKGPTPGRPLDPMADPGIASVEIHSVPFSSLAASFTDTEPDGFPGTGTVDEAGSRPLPLGADRLIPAPEVAPSDGLRLVSGHELWNAGTKVANSPSLAGLARGLRLRVHPDTLAGLGLAGGQAVRLVSERGHVEGPAIADWAVPAGTVTASFNQPDGSAAAVIDASSPVTEVRLEPLGPGSAERSGSAVPPGPRSAAEGTGGDA